MSTGNRLTQATRSNSVPEVVAGIVNDGSAQSVAEAAVHIARQVHGRVRFVQVLPEGMDDDARADAEMVMFSIALRALPGNPRVQATFETPAGDPGGILVERSRGAFRLVVGAGRPHPDATQRIAAYCLARARCRVQVVHANAGLGPLAPTAAG